MKHANLSAKEDPDDHESVESLPSLVQTNFGALARGNVSLPLAIRPNSSHDNRAEALIDTMSALPLYNSASTHQVISTVELESSASFSEDMIVESSLSAPQSKVAETEHGHPPGTTAIPTGPLTRTRNRQRDPYPESIWEQQRPKLRRLYIEEGKTLAQVMEQMANEEDFRASMQTYKKHFRTWRIFKNNREEDIAAALRLTLAREAVGKPSIISRSGVDLEPVKVSRYMRRKKMDPQKLLQRRHESFKSNNELVEYIYARTPSPPPLRLLPSPGFFREKERIVASVDEWAARAIPDGVHLPCSNMYLYTRGIWMDIDRLVSRGVALLGSGQPVEGLYRIHKGFCGVESFVPLLTLDDSVGNSICSAECGRHPYSYRFLRTMVLFYDNFGRFWPPEIYHMFLGHLADMGRALLPKLSQFEVTMRCLQKIHCTEQDVGFFEDLLRLAPEVAGTKIHRGLDECRTAKAKWLGFRREDR